jgi:hypothetical protein
MGRRPGDVGLHQWIRMPNGTRWRQDEFKASPPKKSLRGDSNILTQITLTKNGTNNKK